LSGRLAVTGANGFVGAHLTRLAASTREVIGIVRSDAAARAVVEAGGRPIVLNGLEVEPLSRALAGVSAVVHLAQIGSERGAATFDSVNVQGTRAVAEAASRAGVARLVLFSGLGVAHYGMTRRCTNRYFLSKLAAEVVLYRSPLEAVVFRPSYILGAGNSLLPILLRDLAAGEVELPGDGLYRMQPIAVADAAALVLAAVDRRPASPAVFDLVGPEQVGYVDFIASVARAARAQGLPAAYRIRSIPVEEADRQAAAGGYQGMLRDELDCMLCDEVSDPRPLETLLGRALTPLGEAVAAALRG
jgi:nucleoside-diphosphate-sugar epimerase